MDTRGHHTVLLGMAPGVGKTFRALQDLRRARDSGRDAVIGVLETHGRAETAAQAAGLEVVALSQLNYRGVEQTEFDLDGLLARKPELTMIDELAHTNVPGVKHEKRWQDVIEILDNGIDVISTVNVQHLESLNDQVAQLTGVRVRETVPDHVLVDAEDVVVIDLPPEALLQRLQDGQIYPPERVPAALNNFFRIEKLRALRETALLQAAEEVGARRQDELRRASRARTESRQAERLHDTGGHERRRRLATDVPDAVKETILVLVSDRPSGQRVLRRAWRSARRLHAQIEVLHVRQPGEKQSELAAEHLEGLRKLTRLLGSELREEVNDEIDVVVTQVAKELGITYIFVGEPAKTSSWRRWRQPLPLRLMKRLPGVDIRIVSNREGAAK